MSRRIRRAKEAAKDRIRSVQTHVQHKPHASRGLHGRVLPPPSLKKDWGRSSPGVTLSSIDHDFEAALNDEFNNPLFGDSEEEWQLLGHPSDHHLQSHREQDRDASGLEDSQGGEDAPEFVERQSDPLLGLAVAEVGTVVGKNESKVISVDHATPTTAGINNGVHTPTKNASSNLKHTEDESIVLPPRPTEPSEVLNSSEENLMAENSPSERDDITNGGEGGQLADTTVEQSGTKIVVTDEKLGESQSFASPEPQDLDAAHSPQAHSPHDFTSDAFPDENELMTALELDLPSVDELMEHGITYLRPDDPLSPRESPLSSLPSSYEDDSHFLSSHPLAAIVEHEIRENEENKPEAEGDPGGDVSRNFPNGREVEMSEAHHEETKLKESVNPIEKSEVQENCDSADTVAQQRERRASSQEGGSRACSSSPAPTDSVPDSRRQTQSNDHPALTTTTKHPLTPTSPPQIARQRRKERFGDEGTAGVGSFEFIEKDDELFALQEDYFAAEHSKKQSNKRKPLPKPSGPTSSHAPVVSKRNSEGRAPPPRPKYSPNLQRRNRHSKPSSFSGKGPSENRDVGEDRPQVRAVKASPPRVSPRATVSPSPENVLNDSHRQNGNQSGSELFPDDIVQQSDIQRLSLPNDTNDGQTQASGATKTDKVVGEPVKIAVDDEAPSLPIEYHLLLASVLYLYYSLSFSDYLAGLLAGFLLVYLTLGVAFVFYVHQVEQKEEVGEKRSSTVQLSDSFVKKMNVNFDTVRVYKSKKFTATWRYDFATHHPSQRIMATVQLVDNFVLSIKVWDSEKVLDERSLDVRHCSITLVPTEVAQNRKRRWSKKFPIRISWPEKKYCIYVFTHTSREKEDWYRRLKSAASGVTSDVLITQQKHFFAYMEQYFPTDPLHSDATVAHSKLRKRGSLQSQAHGIRQPSPRVKYHADSDEEGVGAVSISRPSLQHPGRQSATISAASIAAGTSVDPPPQSHTGARSSSTSQLRSTDSLDESSYEFVSRPMKPPKETDWINSLAARLCWDVWHEERWKNWVVSRIQRKLIRVKTPSFMEQLQLTDVKLGNDMPVINRLYDGPKLDMQGIWVFLDVTYVGLFVMTIETKLKLGKKEEDEGDEGAKGGMQKGLSFTKGKDSVRISPQRPKAPPHLHSHGGAKKVALESPVDPQEEIDSGSDDEGASLSHSVEEVVTQAQVDLESDPHSPTQEHTGTHSRKKAIMNVVTKIGKRVANTKIVRRAAEKVSSYPLVLTVEVKRLDGILAVNVPPPPTDTIWYGFKGSPTLDLVAKPKLGHREVTLTKVTHWIEKKLHELVNKKLVLPNMEDLVIPILNSGLAEDKQQELSPPTPH